MLTNNGRRKTRIQLKEIYMQLLKSVVQIAFDINKGLRIWYFVFVRKTLRWFSASFQFSRHWTSGTKRTSFILWLQKGGKTKWQNLRLSDWFVTPNVAWNYFTLAMEFHIIPKRISLKSWCWMTVVQFSKCTFLLFILNGKLETFTTRNRLKFEFMAVFNSR